ncbi:DUF7342 family protein [Halorubrum yunnanense]|uniref:Sugar-specific transcriptional regulator TrmB n=1 Tax=Halorubrum yunnanense TaxID=1526162 RepID=A0ABD5Y879_9EURY|nr:sugar-specific transcriptional regulator TrmB [Halorubrum yunnanense]
MSEFDPGPDPATGTPRWQDGTDTFGRVCDVVLGLTSPTTYTGVAELANCSPNAAKKHLDRLAEMGIARAGRDSRPATYERYKAYLEWQEASRIATDLSIDAIIDRVEALEQRRTEYEAEFGTTDPATVAVFDADSASSCCPPQPAAPLAASALRFRRIIRLMRNVPTMTKSTLTAPSTAD